MSGASRPAMRADACGRECSSSPLGQCAPQPATIANLRYIGGGDTGDKGLPGNAVMVGFERGSTARTAGSDASLRAGRLVAGRRIRRRPVPTACVRGAGLHARWPWLLLRVRTTGASARSAGVPPRCSRPSIRFARRSASGWCALTQGPLIATFRRAAPARCARSPRRVAAATEALDKTAKAGSSVIGSVTHFNCRTLSSPTGSQENVLWRLRAKKHFKR